MSTNSPSVISEIHQCVGQPDRTFGGDADVLGDALVGVVVLAALNSSR